MGKGLDTDINEINGAMTEDKRPRGKIAIRVISSIAIVVILISLGVVAYINHMLGLVTYVDSDSNKTVKQIEVIGEAKGKPNEEPIEIEEADIKEVNNEDVEIVEAIKEENVYNFLICGIEALGGGRGRTDSVLIGTIDVDNKSIKLTSLLRDTYVKIEGHKENKLNASYSSGGMPLLMDTIQQNFGVKIDGYITVNFDGFKDVIDALGGVDIELTKREAEYLNKTNYIADKAYRNVVSGKQTLNGEQALGYSRVRYVKASNGQSNDFGRTYRQRALMQSIFNKYKSKNIIEIIGLLPNLLKLVTTDLTKNEVVKYAKAVITMGMDEIEMNRVPSDSMYENRKVNNKSVLHIKDWEALREELNKFIYGEDKG